MPENLTDPRALRGYAHPLRMRLLGLLRQEGPLTATQAAARLGETVPNCSFHLRQLGKYGLVERAPGADARERPWRATAPVTAWDDDAEGAGELTGVLLGQFQRRAEAYAATRSAEPPEWRAVTGFADEVVRVTADELASLRTELRALLGRYAAGGGPRPDGSRDVQVIQMFLPADDPHEEGTHD